jgi:DNA (cytosine-5)-methyltransferase 1
MRSDKRRLNPRFVEWMMGLPDGWVTGHGLSAAKELKMLGNGVVPQQAHAAITQLMQRVNT